MDNIDQHIANLITVNPAILDFSKWGKFLPLEFKVHLVRQNYFDFETLEDVRRYRLVANQ